MEFILIMREMNICKDMVIEIMNYYEYGNYDAIYVVPKDMSPWYVEVVSYKNRESLRNIFGFIQELRNEYDTRHENDVVNHRNEIIKIKSYDDLVMTVERTEMYKNSKKIKSKRISKYKYKEVFSSDIINDVLPEYQMCIDRTDIHYSELSELTQVIYSLRSLYMCDIMIRKIMSYYCGFPQKRKVLTASSERYVTDYIEVLSSKPDFRNLIRFLDSFNKMLKKPKYTISSYDEKGMIIMNEKSEKLYLFQDLQKVFDEVRADIYDRSKFVQDVASIFYKITEKYYIGEVEIHEMDIMKNSNLYFF